MPKYPDIEVKIIGENGNAFSILGAVEKAMRRAKVDKIEIEKFHEEATSGDYNHVLNVVQEWVEIS